MSESNSSPDGAIRAVRGFDAAALTTMEASRLLTHIVAPRPIAFVSTLSPDGLPNLAPFSYFMAGGSNPPSVAISPVSDRDGNLKDTHRNIAATGEYVINIVTRAMAARMNQTSASYPYGVSEWEQAGFAPAPSVSVRPARVAESPFALECRLHSIIPHGDGPLSANYIIGEVVYFHVAEALITDAGIDPRGVDYLSRLGGDWYAHATADVMFELGRPSKPQ